MSAGADHLATIYGTEKDKVNCSFYLKMGACRHGARCDRKHIKPQYSQTVVLYGFYQNPAHQPGNTLNEGELTEHFDRFYQDVFWEMEEKYGEIEELNVLENLGDHLVGNTYMMFKFEECAEAAVNGLNERWYNGRPLYAELSPVTDFHEASCRQYDQGKCHYGDFCNFMHIKNPTKEVRWSLYGRNDPLEKRLAAHRRGGRGGGGGGGRDKGGRGPPPPRDSGRRGYDDYNRRGISDRDYDRRSGLYDRRR